MSDLYRGHDAKYWHGKYVKAMNGMLELLLANFEADPHLKEAVLYNLDAEKPGWREQLADVLGRRPRPQSVEYWDED